jgi:tyrosine-protein phosphatase SIW14
MQSQQHFRRVAALSFVAALTVASAWADSENNNLPNFHKVDDQVYRGGQPTSEGFKSLADLGIKTVIDLRLIGEHSQADEQKIVTGLGMRYVSIPMHGMETPKDNQVAAVQALFNDTSSGPVFVHCKRGADRTGAVVAVYRISHDRWDNQRALSEAKSNGMSFFERAIQHYIKDYSAPAPALAAAGSSSAPASPQKSAIR